MTITPALYAPVRAIMEQLALVLREGVEGCRPDPFTEPYWEGWDGAGAARTGAPAGHFLFQEGTRLYLDDDTAELEAPYCVISQPEAPTPRGERVPSVYWDVPVSVEMAWTRDYVAAQSPRDRLVVLTGLLTSDLPGFPVQDRLSSAGARVYGSHCIHGLKQEPVLIAKGNHPAIRVSCTLLCSPRPAVTDTVTVPNQPADATLAAAEWSLPYVNFIFQQTTADVAITLEGPSELEDKAISITHAGTAPFALRPGFLTISPGPALDVRWDHNSLVWVEGI